MSPAILDTVST